MFLTLTVLSVTEKVNVEGLIGVIFRYGGYFGHFRCQSFCLFPLTFRLVDFLQMD